MKYKSQEIAWYFFALSLVLLFLQLILGFVMAFAHMGYDGLHEILPFNAARTTHINLLVVWILSAFMGATYFIVPDETNEEIHSPLLAWIQLISFAIVGVVAVVGFQYGWWEGRKFLEIPRPLDYLVVANVLLFLYNVGRTIWKAQQASTTVIVLYLGLFSSALLYLPGMITFDSQTVDSYFRWWVVHLWVEGVWELIMGSLLCYLLIKLTGVDREVIEKWLYIIVGLTFFSGILGTGHHYYWIGVPSYWLWVGGFFSALEPLAFLGMALYAVAMYRRSGRVHENRLALYWTMGTAILSFVGAGFLGFAHTWPQVNIYTHGTLVTAMHGHMAFWGAYAMVSLAIMSYIVPMFNVRAPRTTLLSYLAFWCSNIGMIGMTGAFAVAGITQVYLERIVGMDFLLVQKEIEVHFIGLTLAAVLFFAGIVMYMVDFFAYGVPGNSKVGCEGTSGA